MNTPILLVWDGGDNGIEFYIFDDISEGLRADLMSCGTRLIGCDDDIEDVLRINEVILKKEPVETPLTCAGDVVVVTCGYV